jgi:hypothetical protein
MSKTTGPKRPSPRKTGVKKTAVAEDSATKAADTYRKEFFIAATNMSWQLAVVVLVPIIGGFELDQKLDTLPALTIAGFFVAMAGMGVVVWRQLQMFGPSAGDKGGRP